MFEIAKQLNTFIIEQCPNVAKMKRQLTEDEAGHLLEEYPLYDVRAQLRKMDNWRGIEKKNVSVYATCLKWFEMDIRKGYYTKKTPAIMAKIDQANGEKEEKEKMMEKYPEGMQLEVCGEMYEVEDGFYLRGITSRRYLTPAQSMQLVKQNKVTVVKETEDE
jgi:hypothetical protein